MIQGECNCGAIAYSIRADISDVYVCHCSICRRATGAGGIAVGIVNTQDFQWTRGQDQISFWAKPGHDWHTSFCRICGSTLPGDNDPERMFIPVGTLTSGHENLRVAHHLYVDSKATWEEIGDSGKLHPAGFDG